MLDDLLGKVISGKYRIESLIRLSGPARMYRALHEAMDRSVSILVLEPEYSSDPETVAAFGRHARALSKVYSDNVLTVIDFGSDGTGIHYIVFEPVEGATLDELLATDETFEVSRAVSIARGIAAGLDACHTKDVIHARLSPSSILVDDAQSADAIKIFDFTIDAADVGRLSAGPYAAPELLMGQTALDARSDVFSLGVVLFEMLTGERPYGPGTTSPEELDAPPPPMSSFRQDVPPELEHLVLRAISNNPEMRPQTASEFWNELEGFAISRPMPGTVSPGTNVWRTAFVVLAGILLLASVLIYATSSRRTDPTTSLHPDANGQPVQPLSPATGSEEEKLAAMPADAIVSNINANIALTSGQLPGGDGYNPWANGGKPPAGGPPIGPGGQLVTVPGGGSQFMPPDCILQPSGIYLCPVPVNANAARPTPTPKPTPTNANAQATPPANAAATPRVSQTPAAKPSATPRTRPSPAATKPPASGESPGIN